MRRINSFNEKGETAKCPDCGNEYLKATGYCLSCKKKVAKKETVDSDGISSELEEKKFQERHSQEVERFFSRVVNFSDSDDPEYVAEDIARGIVTGLSSNETIPGQVEDVLFMLSEFLRDY